MAMLSLNWSSRTSVQWALKDISGATNIPRSTPGLPDISSLFVFVGLRSRAHSDVGVRLGSRSHIVYLNTLYQDH
jgi:hypothetical protein